MIQLFVFGASGAYGVGAEGGWADLIKQKLHSKMYSEGGVGEKYELFNFARSGSTIAFVQKTFKTQLDTYKRPGKDIILVSVGGNNSKAEGSPDNFVSTPEEYKKELTQLLADFKKNAEAVIFVGSGPVDEDKTNPKVSPFSGGKSYFTNERREQFDIVLRQVCIDLGVVYVGVEIDSREWIEKYLSQDGLHANQAGHAFMADKAWREIEPLLS